jgi:hypothetical protein
MGFLSRNFQGFSAQNGVLKLVGPHVGYLISRNRGVSAWGRRCAISGCVLSGWGFAHPIAAMKSIARKKDDALACRRPAAHRVEIAAAIANRDWRRR